MYCSESDSTLVVDSTPEAFLFFTFTIYFLYIYKNAYFVMSRLVEHIFKFVFKQKIFAP